MVALMAACQSGTHPVFIPTPPSPSPPIEPTAAVVRSSDIPSGLKPCLGSGPIDVYVTTLAISDARLASRFAAQWQELRIEGATAAAISLFTASPAACDAELGATSNVKSIASVVAVFADSGQADRAWASGAFGFIPPAPGEILTGVARGSATGLGLSSWTYDRAPIRLACWHKSVFVSIVVLSNLDAAAFKAATVAVDGRLN
jgi:hypothetical protein